MNGITIAQHREKLKQLFFNHFQEEALHIEQLPLSGSDRIYFKLSNDKQVAIGAYNPDHNENSTFFYFSELFKKGGMPVPELYTKGNSGYYLQEYIPGQSLLDALTEKGYTDEMKATYKKCIEFLVDFQTQFNKHIDYSMCHHAHEFDEQQILADLLYFKYYFLDLMHIKYNKTVLMEELIDMSKDMANIEPKTFMYRDFQSRNVMYNEGELHFIDYQGGMKGIPQYDIVSLLWQAKAALPAQWKKELFNYYYEQFIQQIHITHINEIEFRKIYLDCVLLRILQTLGAYGFRGLIEKKPHFIQSIYPALRQLKDFLDDQITYPKYQELSKVLHALVHEKVIARFAPLSQKMENKDTLIIDIYSFSYKKGVAQDFSGNGGGYVIDCRGILNPGRIQEYKLQTGMDKPVQEYLETQTKMPEFLEKIKDMVSITVEDYIQRQFNHLNISFGCTGGQHRSVYAAEKIYAYLKDKYPNIIVNKYHLEQEEHPVNRVIC